MQHCLYAEWRRKCQGGFVQRTKTERKVMESPVKTRSKDDYY
jgi:hypothetical protein